MFTKIEELSAIKTVMGRIIGGEDFFIESLEMFNRRKDSKSLEGIRPLFDV